MDAADRREVTVGVDDAGLTGELAVPSRPRAIVLFAHGSGSGRLSPRNRWVAETLHRAGLATLLFDLLTPTEGRDRRLVFDIPLLAARLRAATSWSRAQPDVERLPLGYFGASTGAGAALWAAAGVDDVGAVVSRGGRPDLARERLSEVRAPSLLVVGDRDPDVLELNQAALKDLGGSARLEVVRGAGHLFEEPGALEAVAALARDWFIEHLAPGGAPRR
jgi:putative phosphoribosyl transferase